MTSTTTGDRGAAPNATQPAHHGHPGLVDPVQEVHLSGAFAPVYEEHDIPGLTVIGDLPVELDGVYVRNGPNPRFTPLGSYLYPIDGDGMVHALSLSGGHASYANRFVRTPALEVEERAGRALWPGVMSGALPSAEEVGPELAGTFRDMPDINVVRHAGKVLALAESAPPFCLAPDMSTLGKEVFGGLLPVGITAHPKIDPLTGEMVVFCYQLEAPYLTWSVLARDGTVTRAATEVDGVDQPIMVHDMALTRRYVVLVLAPLYFDLPAVFSGGSLLAWRPEEGTRVALIPRDGGPVRWASDEAFWLWHTANAYDVDGDDRSGARVVLDYVHHANPGMGLAAGSSAPHLRRATIDLASGRMTQAPLDDRTAEFPRIDDQQIGARHRVIAVGARADDSPLPTGAFDALRWYVPDEGRCAQWTGDGLLVGEPIYIARPGDGDGRHGWWGTYATDRATSTSTFLLFSEEDPAAGPVARVQIPVRVPLGLHGNWLPSDA